MTADVDQAPGRRREPHDARASLPMLAILGVVLLITYVPWLTLGLLRLLGDSDAARCYGRGASTMRESCGYVAR
jgi:hypothetical protein